MNSVNENTAGDVFDVYKAAFEIYEKESSENENGMPILYTAAFRKLAELRGICQEYGKKHWCPPRKGQPDILTLVKGTNSTPCMSSSMASLILSVHDKDNVLHFGDEVYSWLCFDGTKKSHISTVKEYEKLLVRFRELRERLGGVSALDMERVGYVMVVEKSMREKREREEKKARKGIEVSKELRRLNEEAGSFVKRGKGAEIAEEQGDVSEGGLKRSKRRKV